MTDLLGNCPARKDPEGPHEFNEERHCMFCYRTDTFLLRAALTRVTEERDDAVSRLSTIVDEAFCMQPPQSSLDEQLSALESLLYDDTLRHREALAGKEKAEAELAAVDGALASFRVVSVADNRGNRHAFTPDMNPTKSAREVLVELAGKAGAK